MQSRKRTILLAGSYGRGNLGDDAFLVAALKLFDGYTLYINAMYPELLPKVAQGKVQVVSTSGRRDLLAKVRMFWRIGHIVYCGGDLWVKLFGDRFPRQSLYKMLVLNIIARLCGKRVHYLGCGVGQLDGYSLQLARASARLAHDVGVREPSSVRLLNLPNVTHLPDLASVLDYPPVRPHRGKRWRVGVSLLYHLPEPEQTFPQVLAQLSEFLDSLPADQYEIVLFPFLVAPREYHDDLWAAWQLQEQLLHHKVRVCMERQLDDYLRELAKMDVLVAARLHANILGALCGVPCIGLAYRPKVARFFAVNKVSEYCLNLDQLDQLPERLQYVRDHPQAARAAFARLRTQYLQKGQRYYPYVKAHF